MFVNAGTLWHSSRSARLRVPPPRQAFRSSPGGWFAGRVGFAAVPRPSPDSPSAQRGWPPPQGCRRHTPRLPPCLRLQGQKQLLIPHVRWERRQLPIAAADRISVQRHLSPGDPKSPPMSSASALGSVQGLAPDGSRNRAVPRPIGHSGAGRLAPLLASGP